MVTSRFKIPTFDELLKKVRQPKLPSVSDTTTQEIEGFSPPAGFQLRQNGEGIELLTPRGLTFRNLKIVNGKIADFQAFRGDKPVRLPAPIAPGSPPTLATGVSAKVTAEQPITELPPGFKPPVGELRALTAEETARQEAIKVGETHYWSEAKKAWKLVSEPAEVPFSRVPFTQTLAEQEEVSLPEPRQGSVGYILDILTGRKTPTNPQGFDPVAYARQFPASDVAITVIPLVATLGVAAYQGLPSLVALTRGLANKTLQAALNTGLDKWIARMSRGIPPQKFKQAQDTLYNLIVRDRTWLQQRATENMLRRMGRIKNEAQAAKQAVEDTIRDVEQRIAGLVPRGTQTGAMAFGGIGRPAQVIKILPNAAATNALNNSQALGKTIGLDVEAIGGIAPGEYWVSISTPALAGSEAFNEWVNKFPQVTQDVLKDKLVGKFPFREREPDYGRKRFLPFKNIQDAQKFLETGDTSLIAKTITQRGVPWTPEQLAQAREAAAGLPEAGVTEPQPFPPAQPPRLAPRPARGLTEEQAEARLTALQAKMTPEEREMFQISVKAEPEVVPTEAVVTPPTAEMIPVGEIPTLETWDTMAISEKATIVERLGLPSNLQTASFSEFISAVRELPKPPTAPEVPVTPEVTPITEEVTKPTWDTLSVNQRLEIFRKEYPLEYTLSKPAFTDLANKTWEEFPEGITKNQIEKVLPKEVVPPVTKPSPEAPERVISPVTEEGVAPEPPAVEPTPTPQPVVAPKAEQVKAKLTEPPKEPPAVPPVKEEPLPEGAPRTLTDLNREAKGMRALSPEERAGVMDMEKPIETGELLYKVKPFSEHGNVLLQPDKPINKVLRSVPGIKQATEVLYPAQMERDNPIALIGIKKRIFEEIETGRARLASLKWWYNAKKEFDFKKVKGKWRATNIELSPKAEPTKAYHATIHDLIEHPENYAFTPAQEKVLKVAQDMQNQILRDAQRVGVDAVELSGDYWHRIVTKAPKNALFDGKIKSGITQKKGYTRQRAFDFVDDGAILGFEYETHPLRSLQNRLEAGIRTISDQSARKEIAKLPGIVKPLERLESRYPQTLEGVKEARTARDTAKQTFIRSKTMENETALRQAEADYVNSMRELYFKKIAAGQPNIGELKLPNGRIAPIELAEEIGKWIELPEIRTGRGAITNPILAVTQLLRSTLTNVDLAAGFIQGQALFYRNNPAWWVSQGNAILSIADDRMAYVEKNLEMMDEGMRMGAISVPTEFMFTSKGIASIPTRVPVIGPVMKAFNRAFEWFIVVGQTEMYKAARSGVIRRATKGKQGEVYERQAIEALTSLGSAIRKEMGTESFAILGVRPTQHTIEQLTFFAARFFRAMVGIQAQAFTGGEGGREARRAMGSLIAGGLALLIAASWATEKKLPNMTDPFAPGWMMFRIGDTYFSTFGPFYPYFRAQARASVRLAQGLPAEAAKVITWFLQSKQGLLFRGIDMARQFSSYGSYRTFEGKRIPYTPLGVSEAVLGEMAVPISIQEATTAIPEGRYESVVAEIVGLVGRKVRERPSTEALSKLGEVDQEALDAALKDVTNAKKIAEIKAKDWTYDIQSAIRDIRAGTKYRLEQDIAKLEPIVGAYWDFAEQKDEYEILSTKEKEQYVKDNNDFLVSRLLYGDDGLLTIPDLKTAEALEAQAEKFNIPLDMVPAFQLNDKDKERIPSDRKLWGDYFEYYDLPGSGGYLSYSKDKVDAGKLPDEFLAEWNTFQKLKTDTAKTLYRKRHKRASANMREDFRRANKEFDQWLIDQRDMKPLAKKTVSRTRKASLPKLKGGF